MSIVLSFVGTLVSDVSNGTLVSVGTLVSNVSDVSVGTLVRYPWLKPRGLCLDSTAIPHTFAGVRLWFQRPTHQGQPTSAPFLPSLAEQEAFAS